MGAMSDRRLRERLTAWWCRPHHRWAAAIVGLAFALRTGWALYALDSLPEAFASGDQYGYVRYAREIAAGQGYVSYTVGTPTAYYPVGYPALLAGLFWLVGHTPLPDDLPGAVAILHAALGAVTVACVWVLGRRAFGAAGGLAAAAIAAVHPELVTYTSSYALETAFLAFALGALAVIATWDPSAGPPSVRRLLAFGLVLGLAAIIRPFAVPFLLALGAAVVAAGWGWRRAALACAWSTLAVVMVLAPWTIRNAVRLDAFVPVSTNLGDTACMSRFVGSDGGFAWADHEGCADPTLPDVERSSANLRAAASFVIEHPDEEAALVVRRLSKMFAHGHSGLDETEASGRGPLPAGVRDRMEAVADAFFVVLLAVGAPGLVLAVRRWRARPARAFVVVPAAVLVLIPLGLWGSPRFAMPLAPFLALGAGHVVAALARRRHR